VFVALNKVKEQIDNEEIFYDDVEVGPKADFVALGR